MEFVKITVMYETVLINDMYINMDLVKSMEESMQTSEHRNTEPVTLIKFIDGDIVCAKEKLEDLCFKAE